MRPNRRRSQNCLAQRRRFGWKRLAVERRRGPRYAGVTGDRAHRGGRVAGEDLQRNILGGEERNRVGCIRPQLLGQQDEAECPHIHRERRLRFVLRQRRLEAAERQHPPAGARFAAGLLDERRVGLGETLRRAQHEPHVAEVERAPAAAG
jgi:hypothetical protein